MKHTILALAAFALAFAAVPAVAGDAGEAAAAWGLIGTWSTDCARGASRSNAYLNFARVDGRLVHRRDFGDLRDEFPVPAARPLAEGALEITIDLQALGGLRTIVFARAGEGKKRAITNRGERGDYSIRDGKFVANGAPVPVQSRCAVPTN